MFHRARRANWRLASDHTLIEVLVIHNEFSVNLIIRLKLDAKIAVYILCDCMPAQDQ